MLDFMRIHCISLDGVRHTIVSFIQLVCLRRAWAFLFATKTDYTAAEALAFLKRHSRKATYNG